MKASKYIREKPVNVVNQSVNDDGSVTVCIFREGWKHAFKFRVKNLGQKNEQIVDDEEVEED